MKEGNKIQTKVTLKLNCILHSAAPGDTDLEKGELELHPPLFIVYRKWFPIYFFH